MGTKGLSEKAISRGSSTKCIFIKSVDIRVDQICGPHQTQCQINVAYVANNPHVPTDVNNEGGYILQSCSFSKTKQKKKKTVTLMSKETLRHDVEVDTTHTGREKHHQR